LLHVIKSAGEQLRPWIPDIIEKMLVLLADLEPEAVNYLIMNADKYNTTGDEVKISFYSSTWPLHGVRMLISPRSTEYD